MNRNIKFSSKEIGRGYQVFKENPIKIKKKKVDIEQHYVVPWELTHEEFKKSFY